MSLRPRKERQQAKSAVVAPTYNDKPSPPARASLATKSSPEETPVTSLDQLSPVEQAVVKLDVDPQSLRPIEWLNQAHYDTLKKSNSLNGDLQRRIEAFRHVSQMPEASSA